MKELVVISGKGGTGKTSIVAALAALAKNVVLADCDVDASDLPLVLAPTVWRREEYSGGSRARIHPDRCTACGDCLGVCRFGAIELDEQCDDGNNLPCDGCSPSCHEEICGNGLLDCDEDCDDGNQVAGDGCSPICSVELEDCGDGKLDPADGRIRIWTVDGPVARYGHSVAAGGHLVIPQEGYYTAAQTHRRNHYRDRRQKGRNGSRRQ